MTTVGSQDTTGRWMNNDDDDDDIDDGNNNNDDDDDVSCNQHHPSSSMLHIIYYYSGPMTRDELKDLACLGFTGKYMRLRTPITALTMTIISKQRIW